jgi:hypothetical protein
MHRISVALAFLSCICSSAPALVQNVIVVVMDGARYTGTFGAGSACVPHLWNDLKPQGTLLDVPPELPLEELMVTVTGFGAVASDPPGIACSGGSCASLFSSASQVTLAPTPAVGWTFAGWGGACSGTGACVVTMIRATLVTAVFRSLAPFDFDADGKSDILWRHATGGDVWLWSMDGPARTAETHVRTIADTTWEIRGLGDQNGDGTADVLWRNKISGQIYCWPMAAGVPTDEIYLGTVDPAFDIVGTGDFDGDGKSDILWRHLAWGDVWIWLMDGATPKPGGQAYIDRVDPAYVVKGIGDLDANGRADIVWHHAALGEVWVWPMNGTTRLDQVWVGTVPDTGYQIQGVADFTGDGKADLVWWHATLGEVWVWTMNGAAREAETWVATIPDTDYRIVGTGDYDGDGQADLLWHHAVRGEVWVWLMDGPVKLSETWIATVADTEYRIIK